MNGAKYRDSQTKEFSKNLLPSGLLLKNGWRKFSKWKEMVAEEGLEFRKEKKNVGVGKNRCEYMRLSFLKWCFRVEAKIINLIVVLSVDGGTLKTVQLKRWGG